MLEIGFFALFPGAPSYFGDDIMYNGIAHSLLIGQFSLNGNPFAVEVAITFPMALLYKLFGISLSTSILWDQLSLIFTIVITFFIGRELFNDKAGIIAALVLAFFPVLQGLSSTASDNPIMVLLLALALLSAIKGVKRNSGVWFAIAGAMAYASLLTTPEAAILALLIVAFVLYTTYKKGHVLHAFAFILIGAIAVAVPNAALNYAYSGNPLLLFKYYEGFSNVFGPENLAALEHTSIMLYISQMFSISLPKATGALYYLFEINTGQYGLVFYAMLISAAYIIISRERRSYFLLIMLALTFLYLEFGPMAISFNPFKYIIIYRYSRFLTILAVPTAAIIGVAAAKFTESRKGRKYRYIIITILLVILLANSVFSSLLWHYAVYSSTHAQTEIANYLNSLPSNTLIYSTYLSRNLILYMAYNNQSRIKDFTNLSECSTFKHGSYIVVPLNMLNETYIKDKCQNMSLVMSPYVSNKYRSSSNIASSYYNTFSCVLYRVL
ncbi:MAG: glycosyltransferase family 39 protein [Candidatus Micrarchaeaceae archaeon]